LEVASKEGH